MKREKVVKQGELAIGSWRFPILHFTILKPKQALGS